MNTWQASYRLITHHPWRFVLNAFMFAVLHLSWLLPGLVIKRIFDILTGEAAAGWDLPTLIALLVAIGVARFGHLVLSLLAYAPFRLRVSGILDMNMMDAVLSRPGASALPASPGEAVSRFRGDNRELTNFAADRLVDAPGLVAMPFIAVAVLYSIEPRITVMVVLPLLVILTIVSVMRRRLEQFREAHRRADGRVTGFIGEMYGAVQAVKVANAEKSVGARLSDLNERRRGAALKDTFISELMHTMFISTMDISTGIILLMAGQIMSSGTFTIGDFALFVSYLWEMNEGLTFTGNMLAMSKQSQVSLNRMAALVQGIKHRRKDDSEDDETTVDTLDKMVVPTPESYARLVKYAPVYLDGDFPPIAYTPKRDTDRLYELTTRKLTYHYASTGHGIEDINLTLPRGSFTVVTGRIGSGKTTLLRALLGLVALEAGEIRWNGVEVGKPDSFFIPPRAAYTGQVPRLFSDSLRNNILLGLPEDEVNIDRAIHTAVMEKDLLDLENGLETKVGPRGVKLSGGQIQRTATARMLAREPELYVFDDLSSALDVETEKTLWERLFAQQESPRHADHVPTCLVVSHRRAALRRADHIIVLKNGRVEDEGTLDALLGRCEEMQRLWEGNVQAVEGA